MKREDDPDDKPGVWLTTEVSQRIVSYDLMGLMYPFTFELDLG